jgi:hypothetical protein
MIPFLMAAGFVAAGAITAFKIIKDAVNETNKPQVECTYTPSVRIDENTILVLDCDEIDQARDAGYNEDQSGEFYLPDLTVPEAPSGKGWYVRFENDQCLIKLLDRI